MLKQVKSHIILHIHHAQIVALFDEGLSLSRSFLKFYFAHST